MKYEEKVSSPLWLEYSGLPQLVGEKIRGGYGWAVFKKIVELDCAANPEPDTVEITLSELAMRCGVPENAIQRAVMGLRKLKLIKCFLPEDEEEVALLKVSVPLPVPRGREELKAGWPRLFQETPQRFRYLDEWETVVEETSAEDPLLQEIVDLYFNTVGLKMNAFILDELRLVRTRFAAERIRRVFRRAQQNDVHSLHWIVKELIREKRKLESETPETE
jgi:hypothetical protein